MTLAQQASIMKATTPPPNKTRAEILDVFMRRDGEDWRGVRVDEKDNVVVRGAGCWYTASSYWPEQGKT